jgi:hypothetical protein
MAKFQFRERIPIDVPHTLMQLLSRFQGVRDGLPELVKNSKDQYSRLGLSDPSVRVIVVAVNTKDRCIGVIDFAGASADQFKRWETWSDPTAHARDKASDIEGGHGNGGKAFMVLGSVTDSSFESCFEGRRTRMGYENDSEKARFKPGIALENGKAVENTRVESVRRQFDQSLRELGLKFAHLPKQAQDVFEAREAYTIAQVNGIKDWSKARDETIRRLATEIPRAIETHPQAALTLESSAVWFVVDGQVVGDRPAKVQYPDPFPGFEEPVVISVPDELPDPQSGELVSTGKPSSEKTLTLRTSAKSLRTEDMKPLHVIRIRNERNVEGVWNVLDLCANDAGQNIYGEIKVPALGWQRLFDEAFFNRPVIRCIQSWACEHVMDLANEIDSARISREDLDKVNRCLAQMRQEMSAFLKANRRGYNGTAPVR